MYIVYAITNINNGKKYIGQTQQTLERRWQCHLHRAKFGYNLYFSNAIRKHGKQSFSKQILVKVPTRELANFFEKSWIFLFNTNDPRYGYNLAEGGLGGSQGSQAIEKRRQKILGTPQSLESNLKRSKSMKKAWSEGRHKGNQGKLPEDFSLKCSRPLEKHPNYRKDVSSQEIYELWKLGWKSKDIQLKFSISEDTVRRRIKDCLGIPRKNSFKST